MAVAAHSSLPIFHPPTRLPSLSPPRRLSLSPPRPRMLSSAAIAAVSSPSPATLAEFIGNSGGDDLAILFTHLQYAVKQIAALVASPVNAELSRRHEPSSSRHPGRDAPKPLDIVSNEIIMAALRRSGKAAAAASEEDDEAVWMTDDAPFVVVTDPLDGSRNIDASIPTGTIVGVYRRLPELDHLPPAEKSTVNCLQCGTHLVAAAYALYSSATVLCVGLGTAGGAHGFTLDRAAGEFVSTHPDLVIPARGQIYSVNDARYFDWPSGLRNYIDTIRQGKGRSKKKYSARYVCSLVADFHRTLLYGGVAMNPREHLRLVYEANPLSFIAESARGRGSDGKNRILGIQPVELHQRLPLFLGSPEDMDELESYGDVQQMVNPGYDV